MPKYTKNTTESFINPYNFVPVDYSKKSTNSLGSDEERMTGVITCSLYTKTPIAILDAVKYEEKENGHRIYPFMKDAKGENYIIPGSSVRGMLRSVHEVVTDSCFSTAKKEVQITARSKDAFQAGVLKLEDGKWNLYDATRYMLLVKKNNFQVKPNHVNAKIWNCYSYHVDDDKNGKYIVDKNKNQIYTGQEVWIDVLKDDKGNEVKYIKQIRDKDTKVVIKSIPCAPVARTVYKKDNSDINAKKNSGYLVLGENIYSKHHESVFCLKKEVPMSIDENVMKKAFSGLEEAVRVYNDGSINKQLKAGGSWYGSFEKMKTNGCIPVWYDYRASDKILYLSPASIGRMTYNNRLIDLVKDKKPCTSRANMCESCSMFGMIGSSENYGSRVRVTDAICVNAQVRTQRITLPELASPRPSYIPFYLRKKTNGRVSEKGKKELTGYDSENYELRGRKFYWHIPNPKFPDNIKENNRNSTVEVLGMNESVPFTFRVYFDDITMDEMRKLVYTINLGQNKKEDVLCHKIGHGKPVGLGSIKIVVEDIQKREFSLEEGYKISSIKETVLDNVSELLEKKNDSVRALEQIMNFELLKDEKVSYPYIIPTTQDYKMNDVAAHKWFTQNYKIGKDITEQEFPEILDEDLHLNPYNCQ